MNGTTYSLDELNFDIARGGSTGVRGYGVFVSTDGFTSTPVAGDAVLSEVGLAVLVSLLSEEISQVVHVAVLPGIEVSVGLQIGVPLRSDDIVLIPLLIEQVAQGIDIVIAILAQIIVRQPVDIVLKVPLRCVEIRIYDTVLIPLPREQIPQIIHIVVGIVLPQSVDVPLNAIVAILESIEIEVPSALVPLESEESSQPVHTLVACLSTST